MALEVNSYGSATHKGKPAPHPGQWGLSGDSTDYEVVANTVLQFTDVGNNNNKFYSLELHKNSVGEFRLFSHYGRTDDLPTRGDSAGIKECRYGAAPVVQGEYQKILKAKLKKGYQPISLAKSVIGSAKARGLSVGEIDDRTLASAPKPEALPKSPTSSLPAKIQSLIRRIYEEAGQALTRQANVTITADGFQTPLGVLTLGQVEKGWNILIDIRKAIVQAQIHALASLSGAFYTAIPHKIGRTRAAIESAIINTIEKTDSIEETLQLMKDMLSVNEATGTNLFADDDTTRKYLALRTALEEVPPQDPEWNRLNTYIKSSESPNHRLSLEVVNIFRVARTGEAERFNPRRLDNVVELFHGTRPPNLVGILTRGLLLPSEAARQGAVITGKMFGPGIYGAPVSTKSAQYCTIEWGRNKTYFMFILETALGKVMKYDTAQPHLKAPPAGYDSVVGTASVARATYGRLVHDECIIFDTAQQKIKYLVEFKAQAR